MATNKPPIPPAHDREIGVEYAPQYDARERRKLVLVSLSWAIPLFLLANYWLLPEFREYVAEAHCHTYGSITGWHVVSYSLFFLLPLTFTITLVLLGIPEFFYVWLTEQYPLPNKKVYRPTKYRYGRAARLVAVAAALTIACRSFGRPSHAFRFISSSEVFDGSCQPVV